ncbi:hypothetical protein GTW43_22400 [Streptomyces sp. SID5785]|uniref:hypothetical protein n=1 Tax=Streptomyces sp. SID5785 TaxID=2690309 RepID=UPI001361C879|nr:hypothetical protein [Streptomyces sp. SID5785]MZD07811.1 hypothetical protein [Streptomyces sp. SID5785]
MNVTEEIMRFAELAARTGLEPELAGRLDTDRTAVLREFGLPSDEAALVPAGGDRVLESLSNAGADARATWCTCWSPELPVPGARA